MQATIGLTLMILGSGVCAFAQAPASIGASINMEVAMVERGVVAAVEAMPEDKYNFSPESLDIKDANFKGVYTFAGLVKHVATTNYLLWSGAAREKPPANVTNINNRVSSLSRSCWFTPTMSMARWKSICA